VILESAPLESSENEEADKRRMLHIQAPLLAYVNSLALLFV
jgi:hypothetical protein